MKQFSLSRFLNVARWDMATNRSFYLRAALIVFLCVLSPVCIKFLFQLLGVASVPRYDNVANIIPFHALTNVMFTIISLAYVFHNLLTRQGRIHELTLPATNLERILWHVLFNLVGVQLVFWISLAITDVVHVAFAAWWNIESYDSIIAALFRHVTFYPTGLDGRFGAYLIVASVYLIVLNTLAFVVLVNAWKYRYNLVLAWFYQFLINIAVSIVGIVCAWGIDSKEIISHLYLLEQNESLQNAACVLLFSVLLFTFLFMCWGTYWLYCRAQITTRRNP